VVVGVLLVVHEFSRAIFRELDILPFLFVDATRLLVLVALLVFWLQTGVLSGLLSRLHFFAELPTKFIPDSAIFMFLRVEKLGFFRKTKTF